jgi:fatty-acyl-CoA synthase
MNGLMMDMQLTLPMILRRAETYWGDKEIVTRMPDRSFHRTSYRDVMRRARGLAIALEGLGLERGDRVATLCWNHHQHMEAYFGVPCGGFVLHTLNLRLHPNDIGYIADHAGDRAVIVDRSLLPLLEQFRDRTKIEHVFVVEDSYEELLAGADADTWRDPELDENEAAAMCYTSGTTGLPKGVLYSHRSTVLHTIGVAAAQPLGLGVGEPDMILPVVPMFHANAWGYPYIAAMSGAGLMFPGPFLDPESLLDDMVEADVTWAAGVPTIWMGILALLDAQPERWDLSRMKGMLVGGSAAPRAMIAGFKQRHGLTIVHGWGMTETSPVASEAMLPGDLSSADDDTQFDYMAMQGLPLPLVELRALDVEGKPIPWDGETMGELEIRGPWVAAAYYDAPDSAARWTEDGWFRT